MMEGSTHNLSPIDTHLSQAEGVGFASWGPVHLEAVFLDTDFKGISLRDEQTF